MQLTPSKWLSSKIKDGKTEGSRDGIIRFLLPFLILLSSA
ncbi:hypothetical protein HMPREF9141_2682 [Prevotella multiformis DSM 16608]|uniref:Uncharacterized protein n=1 Tax=Prevotella multiformis DSM 16608 TaxID=888743 RepID=F0FAR5_9BACT|nr:hypothetical protein HMPREF9141_2682 [Prevotella multiformis DSM 16608]